MRRRSPHGTLIAPPSFIFACLASVQFGWTGLGGFHAETTLTFHRTIRVGDQITARVFFDGFEGPIESNFGGRRIKDYMRQEYRNQNDELVATFICSRMRFERSEMQKRASSRAIQLPHPWTDERDRRDRESGAGREAPRRDAALLGRRQRRRRDRTLTKGPIGLTDEIAFVAAGAAPIPRIAAHRVSPEALSQASALGVSRPDDARPRARLLRALQRLRREAAGGAGGLRRRHPAHVLAESTR